MSDNLEKVMLTDEEEGVISGGTLIITSLGSKKEVVNPDHPETVYHYSVRGSEIKRWISQNCLLDPNEVQIAKLKAAGLIF
jgi:hypothetical protein